jgi:hypothetical protein
LCKISVDVSLKLNDYKKNNILYFYKINPPLSSNLTHLSSLFLSSLFFVLSSFFFFLSSRTNTVRRREWEPEIEGETWGIERERDVERDRETERSGEGESEIGREGAEPGTQGTPVTRFPADATGGSTPVVPRMRKPTNPGVWTRDPRAKLDESRRTRVTRSFRRSDPPCPAVPVAVSGKPVTCVCNPAEPWSPVTQNPNLWPEDPREDPVLPVRFLAESVANFGGFSMKILGVISYNLWWFILRIDLIIVELRFDDFGGFFMG